MKKILGLLALSVLGTGPLFAADVHAPSSIRQVTVYPSSAFVTRSAQAEVKPGDTAVVFTDIVPEIDENSIRVQGKGTAQVKILGAQVKQEHTPDAPAPRIKELETKIEALEDASAKLANEKRVLAEEKKYLDSIRLFANQKIPEDLVTRTPTSEELEAPLVFLRTKLRANFENELMLDKELRENQKKIEALRRELEEVSGAGQNTKRSITVEIEVAKAGKLDLDLSYRVGNASWEAVYDARADLPKSEVELVSYAVVRQNTGENWENVDMVLSTAQVVSGGNMPEAEPWVIRPYQPPAPVPVMRRAYAAKSASLGMADASMAMEAMSAPEPEPVLSAVNAYAQAVTKGVSVAYKLPRKATVQSDGSDHKLPVASQTLKADFKYSAYPRVAAMAYLRSLVTNAKDLQLLGGRVSVFFDGDFVGTSGLESVAPGQEFDLEMGVDENVRVKRELVSKRSDDVLLGSIPSSTKKIVYKYKLTVENYKAQASKVELFDTIPVSEDERIKVKVSGVSEEPAQKDWKDRKGVWRWELSLQPQAKKEILYTCTVEFPRAMRVEGLD